MCDLSQVPRRGRDVAGLSALRLRWASRALSYQGSHGMDDLAHGDSYATRTLSLLADHGQSPWIDYISRHLVRDGVPQELIDNGIVGGHV